MKKLLMLGLMSLVVLGGSAQEGWAWGRCGCNKYTTTLCIRPYNAFSPVAYGSIVADGCMPINLYGGQLGPLGMGGCCAPPSCFGPNYGGGCCSSGCCENGCLPAPGSFANAPTMQVTPGQQMPQGQPGQPFTPPAPTPVPVGQSSYMVPMQPTMGYGYGPIQPAGYVPGYQPMYNPYYNPMYYGYGMPNQGQMPGYWYGH
jgi:hypothetical protein